MTWVFNLLELMVGGFGGSDPVTGGVETREGSASHSDSLLNGENRVESKAIVLLYIMSTATAIRRHHVNVTT